MNHQQSSLVGTIIAIFSYLDQQFSYLNRCSKSDDLGCRLTMCTGGPRTGDLKALDSRFLGCGSGVETPQLLAMACLSQVQGISRRKENVFPETWFWQLSGLRNSAEEVAAFGWVLRVLVCRYKFEVLKTIRTAVKAIDAVNFVQKAVGRNSGLLWCNAGLVLAKLWTWFSSSCSSFLRWWSYCNTREQKMI